MNEKTKSLFGYIFPAMGGLFVTYLYNVVDGIFVGQGVGSAALGAVNIGVPFITFVVAIAAMFPYGGTTVAGIRMGRGDEAGANRAFMTAFSLTLFHIADTYACGNGVFTADCRYKRCERIECGNAGNVRRVFILLLGVFCPNAFKYLPFRLCQK